MSVLATPQSHRRERKIELGVLRVPSRDSRRVACYVTFYTLEGRVIIVPRVVFSHKISHVARRVAAGRIYLMASPRSVVFSTRDSVRTYRYPLRNRPLQNLYRDAIRFVTLATHSPRRAL